MKINLFYVLMAGILMTGVVFIWPKDSPAKLVTGDLPTPPPESVITSATSPLAAPTNLTGHAELPPKVFLSWDPVVDDTVARYRVVRNDLLVAEVTEPRFADAGVVPGRAYGYYIQAIDGHGRFSQPSNFVLITVTNPVATITTPTPSPATKNTNVSSANKNAAVTRPKNTNAVENTNTTTSNTNTAVTPQEYIVTVTEEGAFSPRSLSVHPGDAVTFTYISGEGDEVKLSFTPSIHTTVKLDHERTTKTVVFDVAGTYTYVKEDGSEDTGAIIVATP